MFTIFKKFIAHLTNLLYVTRDRLPLPVCIGMNTKLTFCLCLLRLCCTTWQPKLCLCPGKSQCLYLSRSRQSWTMTGHAFCHDCINIKTMGYCEISTLDLTRTGQFSARAGLMFSTEHASSGLAVMDASFACGLHFGLLPVSIFSFLCPVSLTGACGVSLTGNGPEFCTPPKWQSLYTSPRCVKPSECWINTEAKSRECGWQEDRTAKQESRCLSLASVLY